MAFFSSQAYGVPLNRQAQHVGSDHVQPLDVTLMLLDVDLHTRLRLGCCQTESARHDKICMHTDPAGGLTVGQNYHLTSQVQADNV